jgi:hypothetical protein
MPVRPELAVAMISKGVTLIRSMVNMPGDRAGLQGCHCHITGGTLPHDRGSLQHYRGVTAKQMPRRALQPGGHHQQLRQPRSRHLHPGHCGHVGGRLRGRLELR